MGRTVNILTLIWAEKRIHHLPNGNGCATCYPQSRVLFCVSDIAAVGPTFNIFSYDVSHPNLQRNGALCHTTNLKKKCAHLFDTLSHYRQTCLEPNGLMVVKIFWFSYITDKHTIF